MIRFVLPWRSEHPVRKTVALALVLLGIAGLGLPLDSWAWRMLEPIVLIAALFLAVPVGKWPWPWRDQGLVRAVVRTAGLAVCVATLIALQFRNLRAVVPLWPMFAFLAIDFGLDTLRPGQPRWTRVVSFVFVVALAHLVLRELHVLP